MKMGFGTECVVCLKKVLVVTSVKSHLWFTLNFCSSRCKNKYYNTMKAKRSVFIGRVDAMNIPD